MTDVVEIGPPEPDQEGPVSYAIGPGTLRRMLGVVMVPAALGVGALGLSLAALMILDPAEEIGETHALAGGTGTLLGEIRWASGIRTGIALLALVLAVSGIRQMLGARPRLTVGISDLDADPETLDRMEAAVLAETGVVPHGWMSTVLGGALVVSTVALALNAALFIYAMASNSPDASGF